MSEPASGALFALGGGLLGVYWGRKLLQIAHPLFKRYGHVHEVPRSSSEGG
jgi:hypothetical protein